MRKTSRTRIEERRFAAPRRIEPGVRAVPLLVI
jgi:hypothetical protein